MEFVGGFILEFLFNVVLCFSGALLRWLFLWKKRSYASLLEDNELNFFISILLILVPIVVVTLYKHYI